MCGNGYEIDDTVMNDAPHMDSVLHGSLNHVHMDDACINDVFDMDVVHSEDNHNEPTERFLKEQSRVAHNIEMEELDLKDKSVALYADLINGWKGPHMDCQCNITDNYLTSPSTYEIAWIHPPVPHVEASLNAHLKGSSRKASYIMVPEDPRLEEYVHGMELVKSYNVGDILPSPQNGFKTNLPMELYYDEGHEEMDCKSMGSKPTKLLMTFPSSIHLRDETNQTIRVDTLIDSGATHCFLDRQIAKDYGFKLKPHRGEVNCAGDGVVEIQGSTTVTLQIQRFKANIHMYVIDLPLNQNLGVILGQTWLLRFKANLDFSNLCVPYCQNGTKGTKGRLLCQQAEAWAQTSNGNYGPCLSVAQYTKASKAKSAYTFMVNVMAAPDEEPNIDERASPLVEHYKMVFEKLPPGLPPRRGIGHTIDTGDAPPVSKPAYRLSPK